MRTKALKQGMALGLIVSAWSVGVMVADIYTNELWSFWAVLAIELVGMFVILYSAAPKISGFCQSVGHGILSFAAMGAVFSLVTFFALAMIIPDYADAFVDLQRQRLLEAGRRADEIEPQLARLRAMYTPVRQSWFAFVGTVTTGALYALILSPIVRLTRRR